MMTPCSIRTTRRASRRTTSTWRGSRSQRAAKSIASGRGSTVGQVDDRALGLGHDLLGDDEDVVGREAAATPALSRVGQASAMRRRQVVAGADLGDPVERDDLRSGRSVRSADTRPGRAGRGPRPGSGRRECRGRGSAGRRARRTRAPAASAAATWAARLPGPNAEGDDAGRADSRTFVPRPWRSATSATSGRSGSSASAAAVAAIATAWIVADEIAGRSAGSDQQRRRPRRRSPSRGRPSAPLRPSSACADAASPRRRSPREDVAVGADDDDSIGALERVGRADRAIEQIQDERLALLGVEGLAEPRLRTLERVDRHDGDEPRQVGVGTQLGHGRHPRRCGVTIRAIRRRTRSARRSRASHGPAGPWPRRPS